VDVLPVHLSGTFDGKPWTAALRISDAIDGTGVAKLWARSKIASLEARLYGGMDEAGVDQAIETVALEHHLVSSQTSLVAIDKTKSRPDGQGVASVDMPVNLPDGWVYDKVFGPQNYAYAMKARRPLAYNRSGGGHLDDAERHAPLLMTARRRIGAAGDPRRLRPIPTKCRTSMVPTRPARCGYLAAGDAPSNLISCWFHE
jgi:hypothetical protein